MVSNRDYPLFPGWQEDDTSLEAAEAMEIPARGLRLMLLRRLLAMGPKSSDELEIITGLTHQTCAPRLTEMKHYGWIYDTGITSRRRYGRRAHVWGVSEVGKRKLSEAKG